MRLPRFVRNDTVRLGMENILSFTYDNISVLEKATYSFRPLAVTIRSIGLSLCACPDTGILEGIQPPSVTRNDPGVHEEG